MAVLPDYMTGTITLANGSTTVTGTGTMFETAAFRPGDTLQIQNLTAIIASVNSNTSLILTEPWTGASLTNAPYRARYLPDGARVTAQTTTLIELLGNGVLSNIAGIPVEDGNLLVGNASGQYEPISKDELGTPDPHGSLGKLAALTLAARQVLQTDAAGALKQVALAPNKALATDANGDVAPIDLGTLGRALLALATGTNAQYVQGDGTLQEKSGLPVSTATQTALDGKASLSGSNVYNGNQRFNFRPQVRAGTWPNTSQMLVFGYNNSDQYHWSMEIEASTKLVFARFDAGNGAYLGTPFEILSTGVKINGSLSKASGTFEIDHPLDPFNKNLRHGFVESTEFLNIYRGMVDLEGGRMHVDIDAAFGMTPGTFAALNADVMVSSLQNQYGSDRVWVEGPADSGQFTIICENDQSTATIAWMVTGRRNDAFVRSDLDPNTDSDGRFVPEFEKPDYVEPVNA